MILGTGIDIIEIERIEKALKRRGDKFLARVYTPAEREECASGPRLQIENLAGKFAAKEACLKALGTGLARGVTWQDVSILSRTGGAPWVYLTGRAAELADSRGVNAVHVSISHSRTTATAIVILEG